MRSILVVERDPAVTAVIQQLLEDAGYQVVACKEACHCLALARAQNIDLIVLELLTPTSALAREAVHQLRTDPSTTQIPILICTVDERLVLKWADWLHECRIPVVLKPFDIDVFVAAVRQALAVPMPA